MKKILLLAFSFLVFSVAAKAQKDVEFTVEVSTDSILFGNYFKVTFSLKNAKGENFEAPPFDGFAVVSGPNYSSSFSMVNGAVSQNSSYTFYLEPYEIGNYYIQPASVAVDGSVLETAPLEVMVVPNPDGVKQRPQDLDPFNFGFDRNEGFDLHPLFRERFGDQLQPEEKPEKEKPKTKKKRKIYKL